MKIVFTALSAPTANGSKEYTGIVLLNQEEIISTEFFRKAKTQEQAIKDAERVFRQALYCSHEFEQSHVQPDQCPHTGRDFMINVSFCKKCGLKQWMEIDSSEDNEY